mmetsp:Transcript_51302/g.120535  ORF Transcript_51302/g.120535 Transcript_51302/m.120535 type:complete len:223 (-) Transcript_51302:8-676(-)
MAAMNEPLKKSRSKKYVPGSEILDFETLMEVAEQGGVKEIIASDLGLDVTGVSAKFSDAFCKALQANCGELEILSITDSYMNGEQAHRLAVAVNGLPAFRRLILRGNSIGSSGVDLMAQKLLGNKCIIVLDLDENGIGPDFPASIVAALPALAKLNLYQNQIHKFSPKFLRNIPPTLEDVDLRKNAIKKEDLQKEMFPPRWLLMDQHGVTQIISKRRGSLVR